MGLLGQTLRKRPGRSAMLVAAVAVAVALLVALQSLAAGFLEAQTTEIRDRPVDVLLQPISTRGDPREVGPRAAGVLGAHAVAAEASRVPGVAAASPTLEAVLIVRPSEGGNVSQVLAQGVVPGDHLAGISAAQREKFDGYFADANDTRYANGTYEGARSDEVVVNEALATGLGVRRGDELLFALSPTDEPVRFRVAGTFETPFTGGGVFGGVQIALFQLSELQELVGVDEQDAATRIAVRLDAETRQDPDATSATLAALARPGFQLLTKEAELAQARERAAVSAGFYTAVAYVSLTVSALFVASVMIMEVQERRRDLGVLRAIGWSRLSLFRAVATEALVFVTLGTLIGVALGWGASERLGEYFRAGYGLDVAFTRFTWGLALASAAQSLLIGVAAALFPAWRASRVDALQVIRSAR